MYLILKKKKSFDKRNCVVGLYLKHNICQNFTQNFGMGAQNTNLRNAKTLNNLKIYRLGTGNIDPDIL